MTVTAKGYNLHFPIIRTYSPGVYLYPPTTFDPFIVWRSFRTMAEGE